jgi:SAM-dependent methyltransferase
VDSQQSNYIAEFAKSARRNGFRKDRVIPPNTPESIPTPKLTSAEKKRLIYPYYAGFSEAFVETMLDRLLVGNRSHVLDPWNGSGTTTYIAAARGANATGCDLNPALTLVARARSAKAADISMAVRAASHAVGLDSRQDAPVLHHCEAIYRGIISKVRASGEELSHSSRALVICGLFDTLRRYYLHAKTSNPAWFSSKRAIEPIVCSFSEINACAFEAFSGLIERLSFERRPISRHPKLHTSNFLNFTAPRERFDVVLTSPPYLTRLDYVKATLPELMLLQRLRGINIDALREQMMGSPLVGLNAPTASALWGVTAHDLLTKVALHESKASSTYYLRFYLKYFSALKQSLTNLYSIVRPGGTVCLVVQTSHYKELFIDLPRIVVEIGINSGFRPVDQIEFAWNRSIAGINTRAVGATKATVESAVVLRRIEVCL